MSRTEHNRGREWRARVQQDSQMGRTEGKHRLTSMQVYQDDKLGRLLARVERLEATLREIGNEAMSNAIPDRGFRHYVHTAVGFALEESDGE